MARSGIHVELVGLAVFLELLLMMAHLFGRGATIIVAEKTQQRARQILGVVHRGHRLSRGEFFRC